MKEHNNRYQLTIAKVVDKNWEVSIYDYVVKAPDQESACCIFMKDVLKTFPRVHVRALRFNLRQIPKNKRQIS